MKIIFVLDDQSILVATPEELQLRQIENGLAALVLPAEPNEKGEEQIRPLITYPVNLMVVPPPVQGGEATPVLTEPPALPPPSKKKKKK